MPGFNINDWEYQMGKTSKDTETWYDREGARRSALADEIWTDDMYMQELEKYRNNPWFDESLYMNNPYLRSRISEYKPDFLTGLFQYDYGANQYYGGFKTKALEELAKIDRLAYETWYNNPVNSAAREKSAGLNPDLNGSVGPGAAAENDQTSPSDIHQNGVDASSALGTIASVGEAIVRTSFSVVTGIQNIKSLALDNANKSLAVNSGLANAAHDLLQTGFSEAMRGSAFDAGQMSKPQFVNTVWKYFDERLDRLPYSKREKSKIRPILKSMITSTGESGQDTFTNEFESMLARSFGNKANSRADATESFGRLGGDQETIAATEFMADKIYRPLNQIQLDVSRLIGKYNKSYYQTASGLSRAVSENAGYRMQSDLLGVKDRIMKFFKQIDKDIQNSNLGPRWKLGLRAGLASSESLFLTQLSQGFHFPSGLIQTHNTYQNTTRNTNNNYYRDDE